MNILTYDVERIDMETVIPLGRACECRATRVDFVVRDWLERFPGGEMQTIAN